MNTSTVVAIATVCAILAVVIASRGRGRFRCRCRLDAAHLGSGLSGVFNVCWTTGEKCDRGFGRDKVTQVESWRRTLKEELII